MFISHIHVTTVSSTQIFMHLQSFTYSPFSESLWHMCQDSRHNLRRIRDVLLAFYIHIGTYHYPVYVLNQIFYHQNYICLHMKCILQVFLILLLLSSYWLLSNLCLLFCYEHIFYQINFQQYCRLYHTSNTRHLAFSLCSLVL